MYITNYIVFIAVRILFSPCVTPCLTDFGSLYLVHIQCKIYGGLSDISWELIRCVPPQLLLYLL